MMIYKRFLTKIFLRVGLVVLFLLLVRSSGGSETPVFAASAGGITNLQSAWGLCDGGGAYSLGRCKQGSINYTMYAYACGADNGNDPTHCNDNWQFNGTPTWNAMLSNGYYEIGKYVWPLQTSGVTQNDWVCKVQIDVFNGGQLLDYVTWRDPERCGSPPPPQAPFYTAVSPVGYASVSSLYPTFTWQTNADTSGISYNNICLYDYGTYSSGPCVFGPSTSARSFTSTVAMPASNTMAWLIYGCKPGCAGGGYGTGWNWFVTPAVPGTLSISTTPVSGGIYVDGSYVASGSWSGSYYTSSHTVSFGAVGGYNTPGAQSVTVNNGQTTSVTGTYTVQNGTLTINTTPVSGAIYVNGGYWGTGSASSTLSPGTYTVSFGAVTNYNTPANQSATVYANQTTSVTGTYTASSYTVSTSAGSGGSISPTSSTVSSGATASFTVTPNTGYHIVSVTGCSGSLSGNTYTTAAIYSNCTVAATFAINTYTITASSGSGGTISPSGTVSVNYGGSRTFTITPSSGYHISNVVVDGSSAGAVGSYTFSSVTASHTISAAFFLYVGTLNGSVFNDTNGNGIQDGGESGLAGVPVYATANGSSYIGPQNTNAGGNVSFSNLDPGNYRLEIDLSSFVLKVGSQWSLNSSAYGYVLSNGRYTTQQGANQFPVNVASGSTINVQLGTKNLPTNSVTVNIYYDANGDSQLNNGEGLLNASVKLTCSPSGVNCPVSTTVSNGTTSYTLPQGTNYTIGYDTGGSAPYSTVNRADVRPASNPNPFTGTACAGPSCSVNLSGTDMIIDFLVTNNSAPWIQSQGGDVYSNCDTSHCSATNPGILIHVNSNASSPYFIAGGGNQGGIAQALTPIACPTGMGACSQAGYLLPNYASAVPWPAVVDNLASGGCNANDSVCYLSGSLTVNNSNKQDFRNGVGHQYFQKVVVVNGDITIDASQVANNNNPNNPDINAFLVARGTLTVGGAAGTNALYVSGGLYAKNGLSFNYSLTNNLQPAVIVSYNPYILTQLTSASQATYTWREVSQ
ncbi:MAG: hypothetical protein M1352_02320 [Patescibacteria group bacterium]|nr:hypothetical protein [Patescibacteria group bacterium]